jgi:hypothetical protein
VNSGLNGAKNRNRLAGVLAGEPWSLASFATFASVAAVRIPFGTGLHAPAANPWTSTSATDRPWPDLPFKLD